MKTRSLLLLCGLLLCASVFSQKDYTAWLTNVEIEGKPLQILRVPAEQLTNGYTKFDILGAQRDLDRNLQWYKQGKATEKGTIDSYIAYVKLWDSVFPVHYFQAELDAYLAYNIVQKKREREAFTAMIERREDSTRIAKMIEDYAWINKESVQVKLKPDTKSASIGKAYRLSYVRAYEVDGKPDWAEVSMGPHTGYVLLDDIATSWEELEPSDEDLVKLKRGRYYNFEPTAAYQARLDREEAAEQRALNAANAAPRRNYIKGPKGGCYYINSSGNKQYVDRSFCN
ncbi:MAG: hypothetical protein WDN26_24570 [Chitinophagaceae bacterium]